MQSGEMLTLKVWPGPVPLPQVRKAYSRAVDCMTKLNRTAAILMHKYGAHGATDVSKFGLLGHAATLARSQVNEVGNITLVLLWNDLQKLNQQT